MAETVFGINNFPIFVAMKGISNTYFGARYYTDNIMMWLSVGRFIA